MKKILILIFSACCAFTALSQSLSLRAGEIFAKDKKIRQVVGEYNGNLVLLMRRLPEAMKDLDIVQVNLETLKPVATSTFDWEKDGKVKPVFEEAWIAGDHLIVKLISSENVKGTYVEKIVFDVVTMDGKILRSNIETSRKFEQLIVNESKGLTGYELIREKGKLTLVTTTLDDSFNELTSDSQVIANELSDNTVANLLEPRNGQITVRYTDYIKQGEKYFLSSVSADFFSHGQNAAINKSNKIDVNMPGSTCVMHSHQDGSATIVKVNETDDRQFIDEIMVVPIKRGSESKATAYPLHRNLMANLHYSDSVKNEVKDFEKASRIYEIRSVESRDHDKF